MQKESLTKKKHFMIISFAFLLILSIGVLGYFNFDKNNGKKQTDPSSTVHLDQNGNAVDGSYKQKTKDQILDELKKAQINVTDKVSSCALFKSGEKDSCGSWVVENLPSNNVIMQCEIYVNDKLIARSTPISPNQHIESIKLSEPLKAGSYDAVAYINYFKLDSQSYISKAGYKIKIIIES